MILAALLFGFEDSGPMGSTVERSKLCLSALLKVAQDVPNGLGMGGLSLLVDDNGGNVNNPQLNGPQNILVRYQFQYRSN